MTEGQETEICPGCKKETLPWVCGCGTGEENHGPVWMEGHSFIPMGCQCLSDNSLVKIRTKK